MSDVFVSNSLKDIAFARLLQESLQKSNLETWIDWQDLSPAEWAIYYTGEAYRGTCGRYE